MWRQNLCRTNDEAGLPKYIQGGGHTVEALSQKGFWLLDLERRNSTEYRNGAINRVSLACLFNLDSTRVG